MTPERQKWWDSLPTNEKILCENLKAQRILLSVDKEALTNNKGKTSIAKMIRRQKVLIKAIKHELDRSKVAKVKKSAAGEFYCDNCCQFVQRYDNYCAVCGRKLRWCGRKIEGCK